MFQIQSLSFGVSLIASAALPQHPDPTFRPLPETRAVDGADNNLDHPDWGAVDSILARLAPPDYADGRGLPSGGDRPSARAVSNAVCARTTSVREAGATAFLWQWGQFLDHDIDETPLAHPPELFDIPVPAGDAWFDPTGSGTRVISFDRSFHVEPAGVREQVNAITAWIDASNVYGSDPERAASLRTLDGTGRLRTSAGELLPFNTEGLANAPSSARRFFLAGDVRANEQVYLTAMHTLFVREHNWWAERIAASGSGGPGAPSRSRDASSPFVNGRRRVALGPDGDPPGRPLTGDEVYELARAIVGAEMQRITYEEFMPLLLGPDAIPPYSGYDPTVDASITNEFATVAFRVGHTLLNSTLLRLDANGESVPGGPLPLAEAFFRPHLIAETGGIEPFLRGLAAQAPERIDVQIVDDVRNFLFGPPGSGGFDLASLNVQRGRDHGLPDYNALRASLGLARAASFADVTSDPDTRARLETAYRDIAFIDPWIGCLAEDRVGGGLVGETIRTILVRQFVALRDGDRFWYRRALPASLVRAVERQSLARIIRRNTSISSEIQDDVFRPRE